MDTEQVYYLGESSVSNVSVKYFRFKTKAVITNQSKNITCTKPEIICQIYRELKNWH